MSAENGGNGKPITIDQVDGRQNEKIKFLFTKEEIGKVVAVNPGTDIISQARYAQMFGKGGEAFKEVRFHPPEYVRVKTAPGVFQELLIDGHHRTHGVYENFDWLKEHHPDFVFSMYNATEDTLQNPEIVDPNKSKGRDYLTMEEYLTAILPFTLEQKDIAPRRIAAKLMIGWNTLVGHDLAEKYSALAALSLLEDPQIRHKRDIETDLRRQQAFFEGDTHTERENIRDSLLSMNRIIQKTGLKREAIAEAAFVLVGEKSHVIGGTDKIREQVIGIFFHPVIQAKLTAAYGPGAAFQEGIKKLGDEFIAAITEMESSERGFLHRALLDPRFNIFETRTVITAKKPSEKYMEVETSWQRRSVTNEYLKLVGREEQEPTDVEKSIINKSRFIVTAGKKGGYTMKGAAEQVGVIVGATEKLHAFAVSLKGVHEATLPSRQKDDIRDQLVGLEVRLRNAGSSLARKSLASEIDNYIREKKEEIEAAKPQPNLIDHDDDGAQNPKVVYKKRTGPNFEKLTSTVGFAKAVEIMLKEKDRILANGGLTPKEREYLQTINDVVIALLAIGQEAKKE